MTTKNRKKLVGCIAAAVLLFFGYVCIADKAPQIFHIGQYAYNALFLVLIVPACIAVSGLLEWGHPEFFTDEYLNRND